MTVKKLTKIEEVTRLPIPFLGKLQPPHPMLNIRQPLIDRLTLRIILGEAVAKDVAKKLLNE
jgi:hypothetical protein